MVLLLWILKVVTPKPGNSQTRDFRTPATPNQGTPKSRTPKHGSPKLWECCNSPDPASPNTGAP